MLDRNSDRSPLPTGQCGICRTPVPTREFLSRLGCPECYRSFRIPLTNLAKELHGNTKHGEVPNSETVLSRRAIEEIRDRSDESDFIEQLPTRLPTAYWMTPGVIHEDVVISTRLRLARNLAGCPFPSRSSKSVAHAIREYVRQTIAKILPEWHLINADIDTARKNGLVEQYLISQRFCEHGEGRMVCISPDGKFSIMVNEEDHLRIQLILPGFQIDRALAELAELDQLLERHLDYATEPQFGFLTSCISNAGSGFRASFMVHLPGLVHCSELPKLKEEFAGEHLCVRGSFGEGSAAKGAFVQISNTRTLGFTAPELCEHLKRELATLIHWERDRRQRLLLLRYDEVYGLGYRALRRIRKGEVERQHDRVVHLSNLRLLSSMGMLQGKDTREIMELCVETGDGHLGSGSQEEIHEKRLQALQKGVEGLTLLDLDEEARRAVGDSLCRTGDFPPKRPFDQWRENLLKTGKEEPIESRMSQQEIRAHLGPEDKSLHNGNLLVYGTFGFQFFDGRLNRIRFDCPTGLELFDLEKPITNKELKELGALDLMQSIFDPRRDSDTSEY